MTISPFTIYLWGVVDNVSIASCIGAALLIAASTIVFLSFEGDLVPEIFRLLKRAFLGGLLCLLIAIFTPSSKTIAAMYILPRIAESKAIQQDVPELYNMAIEALKKSLTPEK